MAQWLRALVVLYEFPVPTEWLITSYSSSPKRSNVLFWILWAPDMHVLHEQTCRQTFTHRIKIIFKKYFLYKYLNSPFGQTLKMA